MPDVLDGLTETPFTLRGYPESNSEKLLLILVSRQIERLAWEGGSGTLRSSFQ
jgi:riboflavin biosynthesis pyrimidine reductase